jgi:hypothetical protein
MCINCHVSVSITYFSKYLFYIYCYNFAMKNKSIALTLGILLISSAILVSIPKTVIAQQEDEVDYTITEEQIKAKITEFKTKHPKFAAIVEEIPNLDLKETVKGYLAAGAIQKILKYHAKNLVEEAVTNATGGSTGSSPLEETLTEEQIQAKITEFKTKHPKFAAIVEGISNLDLKETVKGYLGAEVLQKLFKYHAKNLVEQQVAPTQ